MRVFGPFSFLNRFCPSRFLRKTYSTFLVFGVACASAGCSSSHAGPQILFSKTGAVAGNFCTTQSDAIRSSDLTAPGWGGYSGTRGQTAPLRSETYVYRGDREPTAERSRTQM
jgi:hypothetical protein